MRMNTSIKYMDYYIPPKNITVEEILAMNTNNSMISGKSYEEFSKQFKEESGLRNVSVFDLKDNLTEIVSSMVEKLFKTTGIKPSEIKYLVCGNPILMEGNVSAIHYIHKKYNLKNAVILPIFQTCASTILAMGLSQKLLGEKEKEYMLILSSRKSPDIKGRYVGYTVLGDGISVVLIENGPGEINITNWCSFNNGTSSCNRVESSVKSEEVDVYQLQRNIISNGVSFLQRSLKEIEVELNDLDIIIHPNTYYDVWSKIYTNLLNIEQNKFYLDNIGDGGHINDVDLIRNTKDYIDKNKAHKKSMNILIYGIDLVESLDTNYHMISLDVKGDL